MRAVLDLPDSEGHVEVILEESLVKCFGWIWLVGIKATEMIAVNGLP